MKQIVSAKQNFIILGAALCLLLSAFIGRAAPTTYHVSAVNGTAGGSGTAGDPFATIQQCADVAAAGDTCLIAAGTYRETVTPANNGNSTNGDITFKAETGAQVIVNGTERIDDIKTPGSSWTQEGTSDIYYIDLTDTYTSDLGYAEQLFVDGEMMTLARFPDIPKDQMLLGRDGVLRMDTIIQDRAQAVYPQDYDGWPQEKGLWAGDMAATFTIEDAALTQPDGYWDDATIWIVPSESESWGYGHIGPVLEHTQSANGGQIKAMAYIRDDDSFYELHEGETRFYLFDAKVALDSPGEWWLDTNNNRLYLMMPDGDAPTAGNHTIEMRRRDLAFDLDARSYITIQDIHIFGATISTDADYGTGDVFGSEYSERRGNSDGLAPSQYVTLDGIDAQYVSHFNGTTGHQHVQWTQASGIILSGQHHTLKNSIIAYSAGNGVGIHGLHHEVYNNIIHDINYTLALVGAIEIASHGPDNLSRHLNIHHNTIYRTGLGGIQTIVLQESQIHHNYIDAIGLMGRDLGGIRFVGFDQQNTNTRVHHNVVRNVTGQLQSGIYFDFSEGYTVDHNLIYDAAGGININNADNAQIYNNTIFSPRSGNDIKDGGIGGIVRLQTSSGNLLTPFENVMVKNNLLYGDIQDQESGMPNGGAGYIIENNIENTDISTWFIDPANGDLRLGAGATNAIDQGQVLPGFTDNAVGAPDIGASEKDAVDEYWWDGSGVGADFVVQAAPTDLTTVARPDGTVRLNWIDNADNEAHYVIERSIPTLSSNKDTYEFEAVGIVPADTTEFVYVDADPHYIHHFRVRADRSSYSNLMTTYSGRSDANAINFEADRGYSLGEIAGQQTWLPLGGHTFWEGNVSPYQIDDDGAGGQRLELGAENGSDRIAAMGSLSTLDQDFVPGTDSINFSFRLGLESTEAANSQFDYVARLYIGGTSSSYHPQAAQDVINFTILEDGRLLMGASPWWIGRLSDYVADPNDGVTVTGTIDPGSTDPTKSTVTFTVTGPLGTDSRTTSEVDTRDVIYSLWVLESTDEDSDQVAWFDDMKMWVGAQPDDVHAWINATDAYAAEGSGTETGTYMLSRDVVTDSALTVHFQVDTVNSTAESDDYVLKDAFGNPLTDSGGIYSVVIPAHERSVQIFVEAAEDADTADETVTLELVPDAAYTNDGDLDHADIHILDSDPELLTLTITAVNETDAELTWSTLASGCTADLYEDTAAYFTVGGNLLTPDPSATYPYPLPGRLTSTITNYFYLIQAECNGTVTGSNRVGAFTFAVTPGD